MLLQDMRYAFRQILRARGFTLAAVLTLGLGIGASSAIFCVMDKLWLHPIHVPHPGEVVRVFATTPQNPDGAFTYSESQILAQRITALKSVVMIGRRGNLMARADGTTALLLMNVVSDNFFRALEVQPLLGRTFTPQDAAYLRVHPSVLLGYDFWQREFNGDPHIVGRTLTLQRGKDHRDQVEIWGVLPSTFREVVNDADRDLWMTPESWAAVRNGGDLTSRDFRWFNILGRLAPGASVAQVNDQASTVAKSWAAADPALNHDRGARAMSDFRYRLDNAGTSGLVLFAIVGCVVLLAAVNVGHLLAARGLARGPEIAMRAALGARRILIARQLLLENLLLCAFSVIAAVAIAAGVAALLPYLLVREPAMLRQVGFSSNAYSVDERVFLFAAVMALLTFLLLSLVPLRQILRFELLPALQAQSTTRTAARTPLTQRAAIWLQIGISFALLVSTGALVRSFINTRTQSIGLTRNQVLLAWTQDPDTEMRNAVIDRMKAVPGVNRVAYAIRSPLSLSDNGIALRAQFQNHPELRNPVEIKFNAVSPDFLSVIGTRVVRGRGFSEADDQSGPPVVLINQTMARKYWPGADPIGQMIHLAGDIGDARVVGIAEDAPINSIGELPEPYLYVPFRFSEMGELTFALETRQNAMSLALQVRQALIHTHPLLDPMMVTSLPELIRYSAANFQMMAELVSALGLIGFALTIVGLYGFLAFRVTQRRREIGIRMALGASREATAQLVLRDTLRLVAVGLALGVVLAVVAGRLETSVLFGVRPLNTLSLVMALVMLTLATVAASWLPARRAASVEPMQALRTE